MRVTYLGSHGDARGSRGEHYTSVTFCPYVNGGVLRTSELAELLPDPRTGFGLILASACPC